MKPLKIDFPKQNSYKQIAEFFRYGAIRKKSSGNNKIC